MHTQLSQRALAPITDRKNTVIAQPTSGGINVNQKPLTIPEQKAVIDTPEQKAEGQKALRLIKTFNQNPDLQIAFGSLGAYVEYTENPSSSPFRVIDTNGKKTVVRNSHRVLSAKDEASINEEWNNDPQLQVEFREFAIYRAYRESVITGKSQIYGTKINR